MRWIWYEWKEPTKLWVGSGNPCDEMDMKLFYASSIIIVGNGAHTPFWHAPWVQDRKPKDIAPLIYEASSRKRWKLREAINDDDAWVRKIKVNTNFNFEHLR